MSNDEQTPVVADVENVKKSDGTSTAGEHSVDRVNDDEQVPQVEEKSTTEKDAQSPKASATATQEETATEQEQGDSNHHDGKVNNKRDISEVDRNEKKKNGHTEEEDDEAVVSTTSTNKKVKVIDTAGTENAGHGVDADETSSTSAKVPNEELTVV